MSKADITERLLEALYEAWERNTSCLLNQICQEQAWERDSFEEVVKSLEDKYLIKPRNGWNYRATASGILFAENQGIISKERSLVNRGARKNNSGRSCQIPRRKWQKRENPF